MPITIKYLKTTPAEQAAAEAALIRALNSLAELARRRREKNLVVKEQLTISDSNIISEGWNG